MALPRSSSSRPGPWRRLWAWSTGWNGGKGNPNPLFKQIFYVAIPMSIATALFVLIGQSVEASPLELVIVVGLFLIALTMSTLISVNRGLARWEPVPPVFDLLGIGAVSVVLSGNSDVYVASMVLPVIWLATLPGRRNLVFAFGATGAAVLMPHILGRDDFGSVSDVIGDFFPAVVLLMAALIINSMSSKLYHQVQKIRHLAEEQEEMIVKLTIASSKLQESEAKLRAAARMAKSVWAAGTEQAVIATDLTGLIESWGPGGTKLLGLSAQETEHQRRVTDFHLPEELEARSRELGHAAAAAPDSRFEVLVERARQGIAESLDWTYVRGDGTPVPVQLSVTARRDDAGQVSGYLFVAIDQTQAREVSRLKDEFVGLISHELRTPLSSVLGYLELVRDDEENPLSEGQQQYLGVAARNAHRLLRLVGDLLFTAQVESGKFSLDTSRIDLAPLVLASIETARPAAASAGVALIPDFATGSVIVDGDPVRLGQSFDNLISNAIKFTPSGGTVTVSLNASVPDAVIAVRDTGYGIPPDELEKLFGRFFRASTATKNAVPGIGLGLTITRAIITAHGGHIAVDSRVDEGTGFVVTLPLLERSHAPGIPSLEAG